MSSAMIRRIFGFPESWWNPVIKTIKGKIDLMFIGWKTRWLSGQLLTVGPEDIIFDHSFQRDLLSFCYLNDTFLRIKL
jgi:hypothetical protein